MRNYLILFLFNSFIFSIFAIYNIYIYGLWLTKIIIW